MAADISMWRLWRLQLVAMNVYIGPQLEKRRTGVSINSMAGQSSGRALPLILVFLYFLLLTFDKMTLHISKMPQSCSPLVTLLYQAELPGKREAVYSRDTQT